MPCWLFLLPRCAFFFFYADAAADADAAYAVASVAMLLPAMLLFDATCHAMLR